MVRLIPYQHCNPSHTGLMLVRKAAGENPGGNGMPGGGKSKRAGTRPALGDGCIFGLRRYLCFFGVGTVLVGALVAGRAGQHQVVDGDQEEPAAFAHVVHSSYANGNRRNEHDQGINVSQPVAGSGSHAGESQYQRNDEVEQDEIPVLSATGTAIELGKVRQYGQIIIHTSVYLKFPTRMAFRFRPVCWSGDWSPLPPSALILLSMVAFPKRSVCSRSRRENGCNTIL